MAEGSEEMAVGVAPVEVEVAVEDLQVALAAAFSAPGEGALHRLELIMGRVGAGAKLETSPLSWKLFGLGESKGPPKEEEVPAEQKQQAPLLREGNWRRLPLLTRGPQPAPVSPGAEVAGRHLSLLPLMFLVRARAQIMTETF